MKKVDRFIRIIGVFLVFALVVTGVFCLDIKSIAGKIVCISAATTIPDGAYLYTTKGISDIISNSFDNELQVSADIKNNIITNDNTNDAVTVAVAETVMGNVIKKTLSPYSANTCAGSVYINNQCGETVDIASELNEKLTFNIEKGQEPQILIYHTHTTESFMRNEEEYYTNSDEPRTTDESRNIVAVGEIIAKQLEAAGYAVVHDKTVHDYPGFTGSYSRSAGTVKSALEKYPSIKIAIDVHRDSISSGTSDKVAPVVSVDGRDAAQVMLVMGSQTGSVEEYPDWRLNLRLAMKLQNMFETSYPQFARAILLRSAKYNQNLTVGSILIEIGSDANTFEQAEYSGELVGKSIVKLLESQ